MKEVLINESHKTVTIYIPYETVELDDLIRFKEVLKKSFNDYKILVSAKASIYTSPYWYSSPASTSTSNGITSASCNQSDCNTVDITDVGNSKLHDINKLVQEYRTQLTTKK